MSLLLRGRRVLQLRTPLLNSIRKNGFIVLVPEIGEDATDKNPLVQSDGLPEFNQLTIENCMAAIATQSLEFESGVKDLETTLQEKSDTNVFEDVFKPLEKLGANLDMTWGLSKTLYLGNSSQMPTKSYLSINHRAKRARAAKYNNPTIYQTVNKELEDTEVPHTDEENRILKKYALEGKLNGLELSDQKRTQMMEILNKIASERALFKQKYDVTTKKFLYTLNDPAIVRDFPLTLLQNLAPDCDKPQEGPWRVTLQPQVYKPILEHCPEREVRWNVWQASVGRGSGYGEKELSTGIHLEEIRHRRHDLANILGFKTYAEMSMETKMAGSVNNVTETIKTLLNRAKPAQELELANLYEFAVERGFRGARIELWDLAYWRHKQQRTVFDFKEENYKDYFPLTRVLDGLFQLTEKLFDVVIKLRHGVSTWNKDVKFYDIFESHSSQPIAGFYIDPYTRSEQKVRVQKDSGWMVGIQNQSRINETIPLAALVFNFDTPVGDQPTHLSLKEVQLLFRKFGVALQHLLTRTNYSEVSGSSNIEWDAVGISGHLLCHWLFNKEVIDTISCHCDSEDKLPTQMFESFIETHKHLAGIQLSKELYLAALDIELHNSKDYWLDVVKRLWPEFRNFPLDKADSHPCSFTEIFTEEWGAAYYSNIWSRMIAADVYSAFHEVRADTQQTIDVGKRFRHTFLSLGGSCHPSTIFRKFRGRDPSPKALLSSLGLKRIKTE